jgi:hypothetical protein
MCVLQTDRSLARKAARTLFLEDAKGNLPLIAAREALGVTDHSIIVGPGHPVLEMNPMVVSGSGSLFPVNTKDPSLINTLAEKVNQEFHLLLCK